MRLGLTRDPLLGALSWVSTGSKTDVPAAIRHGDPGLVTARLANEGDGGVRSAARRGLGAWRLASA